MGIFDWLDEEEEAENGEAGEEDEDATLARAISAAEAVKDDDWFADDQRQAYVAVAEAALLLKQQKAERLKRAEAKREREEKEREMAERREREQREAREMIEAEEREALRDRAPQRTGEKPTGSPEVRRRERAPDIGAEERAAKARLANAQAAEIEARAELLRAQARSAVAPPGAAPRKPTAAPRERRAPPSTAPRTAIRRETPTPTAAARLEDGYGEADRLALASVGRWPPTQVAQRGPFWTRDTDWPSEWTLTGADLGRFRGEINVTRAVFAAQLGVPPASVKEAEMRPREKVGPALQIALKQAMEVVREQRRRVREERRARAEATPPSSLSVAMLDGVVPEQAAAAQPPAPVAPAEGTVYSGADLARLRVERGLSQRELAALLGVGHGMVGKAELVPTKPLGDGMRDAFARLALPGGATR
jgi:DNA-binding transcriptional regulator YiaG